MINPLEWCEKGERGGRRGGGRKEGRDITKKVLIHV